MKTNIFDNLDDLRAAVEKTLAVTATHLGEHAIIEKFGDKTVWQGVVHIFKISGNPLTDTCYAWSSPIEKSTKRRYYAVLKIPPIDSPEKAVRASIAYDNKKIGGGLNEKK
jgi:hypothetical protein